MEGMILLTEEDFDTLFPVYENPEDGDGSTIFDWHDKKQEGFLNFMRTHYPEHVWSLVDGEEDDNIYAVNGHHFINHIGYIITERPRESELEYQAIWYDSEDPANG